MITESRFDTVRLFKALADETRLRLASLLGRHELSVGELVGVLGASQPSVSRHLKIMADAGLVRVRRDGRRVFYAMAEGVGAQPLECLRPLLDATPGLDADLRAAQQVMAARRRETVQFFDAVADDWPNLRRELLGEADPEAVLERLPAECGPAADLGCGAGDLLGALAERCVTAIGVDNSARMLAEARRRYAAHPGVTLRMGELEHLPLGDAEAASAVMSQSLHHAADPAQALREAARVLTPGGTLVIADLEPHTREELRERFGHRWLGFARTDIEAWLEQAGLEPRSYDTRALSAPGLTLALSTARKR